jgi:glycosyltransferase involved in cell wall biosynthesis
MIRVAYILTPIEFGGAEKVSLNFLRNINQNEFKVCLIVLVRPWESRNVFIEKMEKENYEYLSIPVARRTSSEGKDYFRVIRCFKMLVSILRRERYDVVHTNGYFADIIAIPACKLLGILHIATCHGFIANDKKLNIYNMLDRFILRFSNKIIAVSDGIKNELIKNGIKESRVIVIQNAAQGNYDKELFTQNRQNKRQQLNIREKEFVLGYIGRLSEEKGIKYLIEASSILNELGVPIRTLIIGEGPQREELKEWVRHLNISSRIIFAGFQRDIDSWLPTIDIFVLPSLTEGTPMSLLEAMAHGIPVVATAVGGVPQVVDSGKNGILVSPGKPEQIKDAIFLLYKNEVLRNDISQAAKETIKLKYNVKDWVSKIEAEYLKILN